MTARAVLGADGLGVAVDLDGVSLRSTRPVGIELLDAGSGVLAYDEVVDLDGGLHGRASVPLGPGCRVDITDEWRTEGAEVRVHRTVEVHGEADEAFGTTLWLLPEREGGWTDVEPFAPGVAYGNAPRVAEKALAGLPARRAGLGTCLIREDRMAAPLFGIRYRDGAWVALLHTDPEAGTIAADGEAENGGETLVDARLRFASLGGRAEGAGLAVGICFPGSEGELTYSSGGLPLLQLEAWRRRYAPAEDGLVHEYELAIRAGRSTDAVDSWSQIWRWAWDVFAPEAEPVDLGETVEDCTAVLADQVVTTAGRTGIPLEADAVDPIRSDEDTSAVMGFVGANTDAAYLLLRVGDTIEGDTGRRYRALGEDVLDTFTRLPLHPPVGEGFDTVTGRETTYRTYRDRPAVYARAIAEGCLAALDAWRWERDRGEERPDWLAWARSGGDWLVAAQSASGALPRAWAAGTGEILDPSDSAAYVVVPFLVALARATGERRYLEAALGAAGYGWEVAGRSGAYAGATLDNPDVVDKEAAILSTEGFLDLYEETGEGVWLERAASAGSVAETWIYVWNVLMPADAHVDRIHWKPGVPTIGHQLITTGCSMTDGFLAVNAAAFARLHRHTGDAHWLEVARLVTHGTTTMLAREGRQFDLRGPGWQQEHWSFAPRRGFGLNRRWLPWVPVAHVRGIHRLEDLGPETAALVLSREEF